MPKLTVHRKGSQAEYAVGQEPVIIGRSSSCTVPLRDERASREHCRVEHDQGKWYLVDLNSSNGTLLDGVKIVRQELRDGSVIQIGQTRLAFSFEAQRAAPSVSPPPQQPTTGIVLRAVGGPCDGQTFRISKPVTRIGRSRKNDIVLEDGASSKFHAELVIDAKGTARVIDRNSRNGVMVNDVRIRERDLDNGDRITIGATVLHFVREGAEAAPPPEAAAAPAPAKPKTGLAAVLTTRVKILAVVAGVILIVGFIVKSTETPVRKAEVHPGNLLEANPSFEDEFGSGESNWSVEKAGGAKRDSVHAKDGEYALRLVSLPGAGDDLSALCWSPAATVTPEIKGKKLEVSAWVRASDKASAAFCVAWTAKGIPWLRSFEMGESIGDTADWVRAEQTFEPPSWATQVRVGAALIGQGDARFDGFCLRATGDSVRRRHVSAGRVLLELGRRGEFVVFVDGQPTFGCGRIIAVTPAGRVLSQSHGTTEKGSPTSSPGAVRVVGWLGSEGKLPFSEVVSSNEGGVELRYDINLVSEPDCSGALELLSDESLLRKSVTLETSSGGHTVETVPFEARSDVVLITLFGGSQRVFLALNPAARVSAAEKSEGALVWRIEFPHTTRGRIASALTWSATTREQCAAVEAELDRAIKEEQYGKAARMLREFIARHPLYVHERAKAEQRLRAVGEDIATALKSVEALASRARIARTDVAFDEAKRACEKLLTRLEGDEAAKKVARTLAELKAEHEVAIRVRRNREAAEILARAKEHVERKEFNIARAECNYILEHFADTMHAGEARSILEKLPKPEE